LAQKEVWIGSLGPFLYEDTDTYDVPVGHALYGVTIQPIAILDLSTGVVSGGTVTDVPGKVRKTAGTGGVSQWDLVYVSGNNVVLPCDYTDKAKSRVLGIAESAISEAAEGVITCFGEVTNSNWNLTPDDLIFLGDNSKIMIGPPGSGYYSYFIGIATDTDKIFINTLMNAVLKGF